MIWLPSSFVFAMSMMISKDNLATLSKSSARHLSSALTLLETCADFLPRVRPCQPIVSKWRYSTWLEIRERTTTSSSRRADQSLANTLTSSTLSKERHLATDRLTLPSCRAVTSASRPKFRALNQLQTSRLTGSNLMSLFKRSRISHKTMDFLPAETPRKV